VNPLVAFIDAILSTPPPFASFDDIQAVYAALILSEHPTAAWHEFHPNIFGWWTAATSSGAQK